MVLDDSMVAQGLRLEETYPIVQELAARAASMSAVEWWTTSVRTRARIANELGSVFCSHDLLLTPTMPLAAFPHPGPEGGNRDIEGIPVAHPAIDFHRLTAPFSDCGLPAITVPCGLDAEGLPIGLQIVGRTFDDPSVFRAAAAFEAATQPWKSKRPAFASGNNPKS